MAPNPGDRARGPGRGPRAHRGPARKVPRKGAGLRSRQPILQEDFDELGGGLPRMAIPKEFGGHGLNPRAGRPRNAAARARTRRRPRSCSTCTTTGSATRPTPGAAATGPSSGSCAKRRRARCSPPATPRTATTSRGLLSTTKAERVDGGYRFTGRKSFGSLTPGLDAARHARHGHERSGGAEDRARVHAARHQGLSRSRRRGTCSACARRAATTRSSRVRSSPTSTSCASCPPARPARTIHPRHLHVGALGFANVYYGARAAHAARCSSSSSRRRPRSR